MLGVRSLASSLLACSGELTSILATLLVAKDTVGPLDRKDVKPNAPASLGTTVDLSLAAGQTSAASVRRCAPRVD